MTADRRRAVADGVNAHARRIEEVLDAAWGPDREGLVQYRADVDAVNDHLVAELGLDAVYVCPHDDADGCDCRKPRPGLLVTAAERHGVDLGRSFMVGDRWRDIEAGARAGVTTVWVRSDYSERLPEAPDHVVDGLPGVVDLVLVCLKRGEAPQP